MIHISSGEELNQSLSQKFPTAICAVFKEDMNKGSYSNEWFSFKFLAERAQVHNVSVEDYTKSLSAFIKFLYTIDLEAPITLWFDNDEKYEKNIEIVLKAIKAYGYQKEIILNRVAAPNTEVLETYTISMNEV